jgi:TolA-binding protein
LVVESADEFERDLLRSAEADHPSRARRARGLAALGLTAAATTASTTAAGTGLGASAAATASKVGGLFFVKWVGIAVVAVAASAGTAHMLRSRAGPSVVENKPAPAPPVASEQCASLAAAQPTASVQSLAIPLVQPERQEPAERPAHAKPAGVVGAQTIVDPAASTLAADEASAQAPSQPPAVSAPQRSDTLAEEIVALDEARSALRDRQPARALAAIDDYARRFPGGMLGQEAAVLRIEALMAKGDRAEAARFGRRFLAAYPASPLAPRVRTMLDSVIDSSPSND